MNSRPTELVTILGSGGVGKTTTAAALAMAYASQGKRAVVITVDPAHRLAQVLGLDTLSNKAKRVRDFSNGGALDALWLDNSAALEDLVRRHAHEISNVERIIENRLFKIIQNQLGGIEEYLGVEKILFLRDSGLYDVCVLDTPPSRHAIDFLEAPKHLLKFFDEGVLRVFLKEGDTEEKRGLFSRLINSSKAQVMEVFKTFLGKSFLGELADLLSALRPVQKVFLRTGREIDAWTRSPHCSLALVSLLEPYPVDEARLLAIELDAQGIKAPSLIVLNKCLPLTEPPKNLDSWLGTSGAESIESQFEMQSSLRKMISDKHTFPNAALAEVPRYSVNHLNQQQLLNMGENILKVWQSKNTTNSSTI